MSSIYISKDIHRLFPGQIRVCSVEVCKKKSKEHQNPLLCLIFDLLLARCFTILDTTKTLLL